VAFRNIDIALRLQLAGFSAGLGAASAQVNAFGKQLSNDLGKAKSEDIQRIGTAGLVAGGALLAGFGLAAKATMDFDKTLSDLQAVSGATGAQMDTLRQQALDAGAATTFSASEAAAAQVELAKAGVSTADILGGALEGALSLAAAGNLDLATSATYAANAMTTFGLSGRDVEHIADVLAAAANKSAVDVGDIGTALQQTGLVADQFGLTLDDTVGVLAAFGQAGLKGSDAGTSLKTMLQRLGAPTGVAADEMQRLGISMFDTAGNFIGIEAAAGELQEGLAGLTQEQRAQAMSTIFGADAVRAATILYSEGADGIGEWVTAVNDAGYAEEVAAQKTDNLSGDLEALGGAFETQLIEGGSKATGALRGLTQGATDVVSGFSALPDTLQNVGLGLGGLAAGGLTTIGVAGTLIPKARELKTALEGMGAAGQFAGAHMGAIAGAAGVGLVGLGLFAAALGEAEAAAAELVAELTRNVETNDLGSYNDAIADIRETIAGLNEEWSEDLGPGPLRTLKGVADVLPGVNSGVLENTESVNMLVEELERLNGEAAMFEHNVATIANTTGLSAEAVVEFANSLDIDLATPEYMEAGVAIAAAANAAATGTPQTDQFGDAVEQMGDQTSTATDRLDAYKTAMDGVIGIQLSSFEAATAYGSAISGLTEELTNGALSLDVFTEEGQANRDAISGAAQAALDHAEARGRETGSVEAANEVLGRHVTQLTDVMRQAGLTDAEIAAMISQMGLTPENLQTLIELQNVPGATAALDAHQRNIADTPGEAATTLSAYDRASAAIFGVESARDRLDGTSASVSINIREVFSRVNDSIFGRWGFATEYAKGGIHEFATGGITPAHIAKGDRIRYAEPETGGEAFIPRLGEYNRSKSILEKAAGWYGLDVVAQGSMAASGGGGTVVYETHVHQMIDPEYGALNQLRVERHAKRAVNQALQGLTVTGI